MSALYSPYWYRVADLAPRLRRHVQVCRHLYRGAPWHILHDRASDRQLRFNQAAWGIIGRLDGETTMATIWQEALDNWGDEAPSQDEVIALLAQLYRSDMLHCAVSGDAVELFERQEKTRGMKRQQKFANPFALRFPLFDPHRFLQRWLFVARPLLRPFVFILWLLLVISALVVALDHWPELTNNMAERLWTPHNMFILWCLYPLIKFLHEFGHALAVEVWGGEVHEMGIMLLALTPIPYVDASASAAFPEKSRRLAVAAIGVVVEVGLAALALFVWSAAEPGLVRVVAYNVMVIAGISTLLFNGNPLARYDGYYVLADALEIPNLAQRASRYLGYLFQRYLLGVATARSPVTGPGEEGWLLIYGILAFFYRFIIIIAILFVVGQKFLLLAVVLVLWGGYSQLLKPAWQGLLALLVGARQQHRVGRLLMVGGFSAFLGMVLLFMVPVPFRTMAQGVVWVPEQAQLRLATDGIVQQIVVPAGSMVCRGDLLLRCENYPLTIETKVLAAKLAELKAQARGLPLVATVRRAILQEKMATVAVDLQQHRQKQEGLLVRSPVSGQFILPEAENLPGRFIHQGQLLGYVVAENQAMVRAIVRPSTIALVRAQTRAVELRPVAQLDQVIMSKILRMVPAAVKALPHAALGLPGGGEVVVDPQDSHNLTTLEKLFWVDLALPTARPGLQIGGRVLVRFDHQPLPLGQQWYLVLRQLFLRQINV